MNEICLYYDSALQISYYICIVLIEWSLETHSEHWQHFQSVFLSLARGQIGQLPWVQNGSVGYKKIPYIKSNMCAEL